MSEDGNVIHEEAARTYNSIKTPPKSLTIAYDILDYYPTTSHRDIDNGYVMRYFVSQVNHKNGEITEIDSKTYQRLRKNPLYRTVSVEWKITGPLQDVKGDGRPNSATVRVTGVLSANKKAVMLAEEEMPGIKYKLMDFKQLWRDDTSH